MAVHKVSKSVKGSKKKVARDGVVGGTRGGADVRTDAQIQVVYGRKLLEGKVS